MLIVSVLLILNVISCVIFRFVAGGYPDIIHYRELSGGKMTYVIAGNLGQADEASAMIADDIVGGVTFVNFSSFGYSPSLFRQRIQKDMDTYPEGTEFAVVAISLGNQVAQELAHTDGVIHYAINPCVGVRFLNPTMKVACVALAIVGTPVEIALGWLAYVPIFNVMNQPPTRNYSVATLIGQFRAICFGVNSMIRTRLTGVVVSKQDELLDNSVVRSYYKGCQIVEIDAKHGSINNYPEAYRDALRELGLFD